MWSDYESSYDAALRDTNFLAWREAGAREKALNILRVCHSIEVQSAVEIGCGTGAVLRHLQSLRFAERYAGVDIALSAVEYTRQSCRNSPFQALVGSATSVPFPDSVFDVAILSHVIEHLDDPIAALREASRIARFVVVEVPTEKVFSNTIRRKLLGRTYASIQDAGHIHFWSPDSIEAFLRRDCSFEILACHRDLISKDIERFGKTGLHLAKPLLKQGLKAALPEPLYTRLLTTHATFLCRGSKSSGGSMRSERSQASKSH